MSASSWRKVSISATILTAFWWLLSETASIYPTLNIIGDISDVANLARLSFATAILSGIGAWRADVPPDTDNTP